MKSQSVAPRNPMSVASASRRFFQQRLSAASEYRGSRALRRMPLTDAQRDYLKLAKWDGVEAVPNARQQRRHP